MCRLVFRAAVIGALWCALPIASANAAAQVTKSSDDITFDDVDVGSSKTKEASITNSGTEDVGIDTLQRYGPMASEFAITKDDCSGRTLAPSASCSLSITFSPAKEGIRVAHIYVPIINGCAVYFHLAGSGHKTSAPATATASDCTVTTPDPPDTSSSTEPAPTVTPEPDESEVLGVVVPGGSANTCSSRKKVRVHFRLPKGATASRLKVRTGGRTFTVHHRKGGRYYADVTLRRLARGEYTVRIRAVLRSGKRFAIDHRFVTCGAIGA